MTIKAGAPVQYYTDDTGIRTGRYVTTIERGANFGLMVIKPTAGVPRRLIKVRPDAVRCIMPAGAVR